MIEALIEVAARGFVGGLILLVEHFPRVGPALLVLFHSVLMAMLVGIGLTLVYVVADWWPVAVVVTSVWMLVCWLPGRYWLRAVRRWWYGPGAGN